MDVGGEILAPTSEISERLYPMDNAVWFLEQVRQHFGFLVNEFGFRICKKRQQGDRASVEYCSEKVYVRLFQGPPDFEPQLAFGRIDVDDAPGGYGFGQGDLTLLTSCDDWHWHPRHSEPDGGLIPELARLLRECGARCLQGNDDVFSEMRERREQLANDWREAERVQSLRVRAESAWERKDLRAVIALYAEIDDQLTNVEQKRLSYAKSQTEAQGKSGTLLGRQREDRARKDNSKDMR